MLEEFGHELFGKPKKRKMSVDISMSTDYHIARFKSLLLRRGYKGSYGKVIDATAGSILALSPSTAMRLHMAIERERKAITHMAEGLNSDSLFLKQSLEIDARALGELSYATSVLASHDAYEQGDDGLMMEV